MLFLLYIEIIEKKKNRSQEDRRKTKDMCILTRQVFLKRHTITLKNKNKVNKTVLVSYILHFENVILGKKN